MNQITNLDNEEFAVALRAIHELQQKRAEEAAIEKAKLLISASVKEALDLIPPDKVNSILRNEIRKVRQKDDEQMRAILNGDDY